MKHTFSIPSADKTFLIEHVEKDGETFRYHGSRIEGLDVAWSVRPLRWFEIVMPWRWRRSARTIIECNAKFSADAVTKSEPS